MLRSLLAAGVLIVCSALPCRADTIFVDNLIGRDVFDGTAETPITESSGPVRTLRRAMLLARTGDTIVLKNNEVPYYDSFQLSGPRHSGYPGAEFRIVGNGVILDGSREAPPEAWQLAGENLWKLIPWRKGHFLLLLGDRPVPEVAAPGSSNLPELPAGHWCAWRGEIFYRSAKGEPADEKPFRIAVDDVGLSLFAVENVRISDLTLRHFRIDGASAHDRCRNVVLERVTATGNGRAGLFVGGSSKIVVERGGFLGNRKRDVLFSELGSAVFDETRLGSPPVGAAAPQPAEPQRSEAGP
jgi:hypothetical protein